MSLQKNVLLSLMSLALLAYMPQQHALQKMQARPSDAAQIAAISLTALGLGGMAWYILNARNKQYQLAQAQAHKAQQQEAKKQKDLERFYRIISAPSANRVDFLFLERVVGDKTITINQRDKEGSLPLILAAQAGNKEVVAFLLAHGAKVNGLDLQGNSALMKAAERNHLEIINLLLEKNANAHMRNKNNKSAYELALEQRHFDAAKKINQYQFKKELAFVAAAAAGDFEKVKNLLPEVALDSYEDNHGNPAIFEAVRQDHKEIFNLLLERGASVNKRNAQNETILFAAVRSKNPYYLQFLLEHRPPLNIQDSDGNTALMHAAAAEKQDRVEMLLRAGANPNIKNSEGYTAFDMAHTLELRNLLRRYSSPQDRTPSPVRSILKKNTNSPEGKPIKSVTFASAA